MDIRTLGLVVTNEAADADALRAATAIALREDAHLVVTCLGVEPLPIGMVPIDGVSTAILDTGRAEAEERARALAAWARADLPPGLRATVEPVTVPEPGAADSAARHARFADLLVQSHPFRPRRAGLARAVAEGLLLGTGAPLLVVPEGAPDAGGPFRRICVGWDDSGPALRAVRAALPFLTAAERVDIAIVDPPVHAHGFADPGGALSLWLSRHGVKASVAVLARTEPQVADVLARFARESGSEAIVMGAYGHSRLREAILGGTTRDMLSAVPLPLLMAH